MLAKLTIRNAKRSMKDYLVYLVTMTGIAALMYAFNAMIFSKDIQKMCMDATVMGAMIGLATFFIVLIVAWLIHYMVRFMLEKRSREFGTYLLLGMEKKQISSLYMKENMLMGLMSLVMGLIFGVFLQQILMTVFYRIFSQSYALKVEITKGCILMTLGCYLGCYLLALFRNRRLFKKMTISDFMRMEKENEKVKEGGEKWKQWLAPVAVSYVILFNGMMFRGRYTVNGVVFMSIGFIAAIYLFYLGVSAFLVRYIKRGGSIVYKKQNLFLFRQTASKLKTMGFTMGTLTLLLTCALLGGTVAMMFAKYQDQALMNAMPFDVLIYSNDPADDFAKEIETIEKEAGIRESLRYNIYQNGNCEMNDYLYTHANTINKKYRNKDGSVNREAVAKDGYEYYDFDTYIALSDYNALRKMLGQEEITLSDNGYAIQIKQRLEKDLNDEIKKRELPVGTNMLQLEGIYTEHFSQNGINGADYLIVVPDNAVEEMTPYYINLAVSTSSQITAKQEDAKGENLQIKLENIRQDKNGIMPEEEFDQAIEEGRIDEDAVWEDTTLGASGTDQIIVVVADVMVAGILGQEMKFVMTAVIFPLAYIGLVFVCVALTILAVQQLSDSNKYKFRYDVLKKLGMNQREISILIGKQLSIYYLLPMVISLLLSGSISIFAGSRFVRYTGAMGNGLYYFFISAAVFLSVYVCYFAVTYLGFERNVK